MLGRTRALEVHVCLGNWQAKRAAQPKDVVGVLGCRLVPEMTEELYGCRDARNRFAPHSAKDEALGRIAKEPTAGLRLQPTAVRVEGDGVEVELLTGAAKDETNR